MTRRAMRKMEALYETEKDSANVIDLDNITLRERNAELERELSAANEVITNIGRVLSAAGTERASLEAQLEAFRVAATEARDTVVTTTVCVLKPRVFDTIMSALAASESIVGKSEGENDGVE